MAFQFPILESANYDGDSFDFSLDLGFGLVLHRKCRLDGIDTPELRGGTEESKAAGRLARDKARAWVEACERPTFVSETYAGKFGRPLGDVVDGITGASLREYLLTHQYGVPYHGQAKADIQSLHDENIAALKARREL